VGDGVIVAEGHPEDAISEVVLEEIYQNICSVRTLDGVQMVMPRCVVERNKKLKSDRPSHDVPLARAWSGAETGS